MAKYIDADALFGGAEHLACYDNRDRDAFEDLILSMPAADVEPVRRWQSIKIPPENQGQYLVMDEDGNMYNCEYFVDYESFGYEDGHYDPVTLGFVGSEFCKVDVIFWMDLPEEPPKMDGGSE